MSLTLGSFLEVTNDNTSNTNVYANNNTNNTSGNTNTTETNSIILY